MDRGDPDAVRWSRRLRRSIRCASPPSPVFALALGLTAAACAESPELGAQTSAATVGDYVTTACSTAVVLELSRQIAAEVDCLDPGQLVAFPEGNGIAFTGGAILPYVSEAARADLLDAVAAGGGLTLELTSAYRTVAQQYLLYRWYQLGRCGIPIAAAPGASNHESGRAIDVRNWSAWVTLLGAHGWSHDVPGDDVPLRSRGVAGSARHRRAGLPAPVETATQPSQAIDEDGVWGPMTELAMRMAPAEGFPARRELRADRSRRRDRGGSWRHERWPAGASFAVIVWARNTGTMAWPAGTALVTAEPLGRASALAGGTWPAPDRPAVLAAEVAPGDTVEFAFAAVAPQVPTDTELAEVFTLAIGRHPRRGRSGWS
jgi:hypothetical protein